MNRLFNFLFRFFLRFSVMKMREIWHPFKIKGAKSVQAFNKEFYSLYYSRLTHGGIFLHKNKIKIRYERVKVP
jgi:hypothetical protein